MVEAPDVLVIVLHLVHQYAQMAAIQVVLVALANVQKIVPTIRIHHVQDVPLNVQKRVLIIITTQVVLLVQIVARKIVQEIVTTIVIKDAKILVVEHATHHVTVAILCAVTEVKQRVLVVGQSVKVDVAIPVMDIVMEL